MAAGCVSAPDQTAAPAQATASGPDGKALFADRCASCHVETTTRRVGRPLPPSMMATLPPQAIVDSMTIGRMINQAAGLSDAEKLAIAHYAAAP